MPGATITIGADTFTRANQSGFGTASNGATWATNVGSPTLSIASNEGHATGITAQAMMQLGSATSANQEGLVRVKTSNSSSTRMGVALRATASNTFYHGRLSSNINDMRIGKVVSGTNTDLFTVAFTTTAATFYWIRFRVVGTNLYCKAWADGSGEPASWTLTGTDSSITGAGGFGLTINASSSATTWDFDSYTVTDATLTETLQVRARIATQSTKTLQSRLRLNTLKTKTLQTRFILSTVNSANKTLQARFRLRTQLTETLQARFRLSTQSNRTLQTRARITTQRTGTLQTRFRLTVTKTKTLQARLRLNTGVTKTLQARTRLTTQSTKTLQARFRLTVTQTKTLQSRLRLRTQSTKTLQVRAVIGTVGLTSGGFVLFANGTGTATFDHVRFTQYPDPALSLAPVLDRLGTSNVAWNSVVATNTTLGVKTSIDGVNFSTATSGSSIPGLTGQPDPVIDLWTTNTSSNYTNTNKSGGSTATVTYDTTNSRITLAGGSGGLYLNSTISDDDVDVIADMDRSDAGGLVWRFVDNQNFYELGAYDDSASGGFTNQLRLYKVASGTRTLLGSASAVTWYRNTPDTSPYKRIRVTMLGAVITVYFDGTQVQQYTDGSPLAAGKVGLRNDGGTSRYYQLRIQQQGDYVSGVPAGDVVTGKFVYTEQDLATTDPSVTPQVLDITTSARSPKIATGALIPQLHDPSKPFATFFNAELDTLAQSSGDFFHNVDQNGALTFTERHATPAPFCIHSTDLLFSPQVTPTNAADLYRNQQVITNTLGVTSTQHEEKVADGSASSWNMAYPLYSAPTITVGGVTKTVGIQGQDTGRDFYWQAGSASIGQDVTADIIPSGYVLTFDYVGQFPDQVVRNNLTEQAARALVEGGSGIVCAIEDGKGMLSSNAIVKADGLLARHSNNDTVEVVMTTEKRLGTASGTVIPCFLPEHHINNRQLLITKVGRTGYMKNDGTTVYRDTITATDGANQSNWSEALGL